MDWSIVIGLTVFGFSIGATAAFVVARSMMDAVEDELARRTSTIEAMVGAARAEWPHHHIAVLGERHLPAPQNTLSPRATME